MKNVTQQERRRVCVEDGLLRATNITESMLKCIERVSNKNRRANEHENEREKNKNDAAKRRRFRGRIVDVY